MALLCYTYVKTKSLPLGKRIAAIGLKLLGLALLALCLLELTWIQSIPKAGKNIVAIVADNSRSLSVKESPSENSRAEQLRELLHSDNPSTSTFVDHIESQFQVRRFALDSKLTPLASFGELDQAGPASRLNSGLSDLANRYDGQPLSAVVILTDGNHTDAAIDLSSASLPPVFVVHPGGGMPSKDLAIGTVLITESAFEDSPITVEVHLTSRGYPQATASLYRQGEATEPVASQLVRFEGESSKKVRFTFRPTQLGVSFYRIEVATDAPETEATLANNERIIAVEQNTGPHRILYLSGRPNWDFKFFRRALHQDQSFKLSALQRIAKREPKFQWRGRSGEESNPLFRGFDREDETEGYDEPVLVRLVVQDDELANGFPTYAEGLYPYKAVVIDDLEADFFTPDQQELLETFVAKRGGSVLFLGGSESFADGGYDDSLFTDLLPVYLGAGSAPVAADHQLRMGLTREGMLEFWLRLRQLEAQEKARLRNMASFTSVSQVRATKPGASLYATVQNAETGATIPAIAVQRFGAGKVAACMIGDMWRWGFLEPNQANDRDKLWRQFMRHLTVDVPDRIRIQVDSGEADSQEKQIKVWLKNEKFDPQYNGQITLTVTDPSGEIYTFPANPDDVEPGLYRGVFLANQDGGYTVRAVAKPLNDGQLTWHPVETGWAINRDAEEYRTLGINRAWSEQITQQTGGQIIDADQVDDLVDLIASTEVPEVEIKTTPIWHTPWLLIAAILCFVGEWAIRRNNSLA